VSRQPVVALTATTELLNGRSRIRLNTAYANAFVTAGMTPLVVPPLDPSLAGDVVAAVDGIVLTGGEDVDPARYGAKAHPATEGIHAGRDAWEIALLMAARAARRPTLAICRGIQVANVALGGTLVQDLPTERPSRIAHARSADREARVHEISVIPGSRLAAALGATALTANSSHHQAIDRAAGGLAVTATAPDGVVEGAEWTGDDGWWMLGVQWHPEELVRTAEGWDRALFAAFRAAMLAGPPRR